MLAATQYGNYGLWSPPMVSVHGDGVDSLITTLHWFMFLLFVPWAIFFVYCLVRFRRRAGHTASYTLPKAKISKYGEIAVVIFEVILLVGFSVPVWAEYRTRPPVREDRLEIRMVAQQFQWNIHYAGPDGRFGRTSAEFISDVNAIGLDESDPAAADDVQTINDFHLPVGKDIYVRLTSMDVVHSFSIPTMRVKQDVIPGMEIPVWFKIKEDATSENLRAEMTRSYPIGRVRWDRLRHHIATEDYKDRTGQVLLAKGGSLGGTFKAGAELIDKLRQAGVAEISMQPRHPLELVCAQLCGNSHFTMKAQLVTHTPEGFDEWIAEQSKEVTFDEDF